MPDAATPLQLFWFVLIGVLLVGYAVLDGFDLGVGILHLFAQGDHERRVFMNAIGPLWDGNEVWLVVFGGALFAAFPEAYSAAFSLFYTPFMLLLFALIFRAVSLEFRSKTESTIWRSMWDMAFCASSVLATFLFGVAVGDSIIGLPIEGRPALLDEALVGQVGYLLRPYALLVGLFAIATFAMHGSIFLYLKTEGALQQRVHGWMWRTYFVFLAMYVITTLMTVVMIPHATTNFRTYPWAWVVVFLNVLAVANIPRAIYRGRPFDAILSSGAVIAAFTFLFGVALFPNLIVSSIDPKWNLTISTSASTEKALGIMTIVAILGMPFVISYTAVVYWVFRGKVQVGHLHY